MRPGVPLTQSEIEASVQRGAEAVAEWQDASEGIDPHQARALVDMARFMASQAQPGDPLTDESVEEIRPQIDALTAAFQLGRARRRPTDNAFARALEGSRVTSRRCVIARRRHGGNAPTIPSLG